MATNSKTISLQDLSSAVHTAVGKLKAPIPVETGPYAYINPSLICGIWFSNRFAQAAEAREIAATIASEVSAKTGVKVAPVVQEAGAQESAAVGGTLFPIPHLICGFKPIPETIFRF
jgi:hypothetical protein